MILSQPKFIINVPIFYFEIVHFPILNGDVPRPTSYGVYIFQVIRFARASNHAADLNTCSESSEKAIGIINLAKLFLYCIADTMIRYLFSMPDLNLSCARDFRKATKLVYKLKNIVGTNIFSTLFIK